MQTQTREHRLIMAPPLARPVSKTWGFADFAKLFFITLTFLIVLAITGIGVWYFWTFFQTTSYKLVAAFLLLITVSNIICQYGLWYWQHYGESSNP